MTDLRSIGITKQQEELFLKVKKAVGNDPGLERDLDDNPEKIYLTCKHSGYFSESELDFLEETFKTPIRKKLIQRIKEYIGL